MPDLKQCLKEVTKGRQARSCHWGGGLGTMVGQCLLTPPLHSKHNEKGRENGEGMLWMGKRVKEEWN